MSTLALSPSARGCRPPCARRHRISADSPRMKRPKPFKEPLNCNVCYRTCNSTKKLQGSSLFRVQQPRGADMRLLTHREKLTLYRHRLAEAQTQEEREKILRLLAKEEAKDGIGAYLLGTSKNSLA